MEDQQADETAVTDAVAVVVDGVGVSGEVERCVALRLAEQPDLVEVLIGGEDGVSGRASSLASDCGRALDLADGFVDNVVEGDATDDERECFRDVFVGLSAAERVGVTAAVTGTGDDEDLDAAAEMAAGVAACREAR